MAKILNQLLYSQILFGGENPGDTLALYSTSSSTKGVVQILGTSLDLIIAGIAASVVHTNTVPRTYSLPDYSGQILVSGLFTTEGQILFASAASTYAVLSPTLNGTLTANSVTGRPQWITGVDGQFLSIVGTTPQYANLPDRGIVNYSPAGNTLSYYIAPGRTVDPFPTVASSVLLTNGSSQLLYGLISTNYMKSSGGIPLVTGNLYQLLQSNGDNSFSWIDPNPAVVSPGAVNFLSYYSAIPTGTTISASSFIKTDESLKTFSLLSQGKFRLFHSGSFYVELKAPSLSTNIPITLPSALPTEVAQNMVSDPDGLLRFETPGTNRHWEQRGWVSLQQNARSVCVVYNTPFISKPDYINLQYSSENIDIAYLPTYTVAVSSKEGFTAQFSTAIPSSGYKIYWESSLLGDQFQSISSIYLSGGDIGIGYSPSFRAYQFDTNTLASVGSFSMNRAYSMAGSSPDSGYIFGGQSDPVTTLNTITSYYYSLNTLVDLAVSTPMPVSGGASLGGRSHIYYAGGEAVEIFQTYFTVIDFATSSETISTTPATLTGAAIKRGSATNESKGLIVHSDVGGTIDIFNYLTTTLALSPAAFGMNNFSVGCNNVEMDLGYFGNDNGTLASYEIGTNTIVFLPATLNSVTGLSSASNSMVNGYFTGVSLLESLNFATETLTVENTIGSNFASDSVSTFQSKGLI